MRTMDVRIKVTADIIKESDKFGESEEDSSEKADREFKFYHNQGDEVNATIKDKSTLVTRAKIFQKKCLARLVSLAVT